MFSSVYLCRLIFGTPLPDISIASVKKTFQKFAFRSSLSALSLISSSLLNGEEEEEFEEEAVDRFRNLRRSYVSSENPCLFETHRERLRSGRPCMYADDEVIRYEYTAFIERDADEKIAYIYSHKDFSTVFRTLFGCLYSRTLKKNDTQ